ncbi:class I SAM-dependent methyltransferase [Streptomyces cavourensis]|uniref:class I SAM-dependent methyltransferase n=1 Tax=Streptomyces cavourensis TaxID=67258 RepID=UPI000DC662B1|nr:class I SAM-dependent methyltransferase [Streptomyces cavourensis]ATY99896.1 SAM-dependent methyltransferase [Streptomyces cavourensis]
MTTTADLWHHYGRVRAERDRGVPGAFRWTWGQDDGPGAEVLGELRGRVVGDLGAGAARQAAHLAVHHEPARVVAVDASPAQYGLATGLFSRLAPRLRIVRSDAVRHLEAARNTYDVLYSVFGAVDFTDPRELLPAAAAALRPGGRLAFATLAHYLNSAPAQWDVVAAEIPAKTPEGEETTMRRWVLQDRVWVQALDAAGFTGITVDTFPAASDGPRSAATLLVTAERPGCSGGPSPYRASRVSGS